MDFVKRPKKAVAGVLDLPFWKAHHEWCHREGY